MSATTYCIHFWYLDDRHAPQLPFCIDVDHSEDVNEWAAQLKEAVRERAGVSAGSHIYFHGVEVTIGGSVPFSFTFKQSQMTNAVLARCNQDRLDNYAAHFPRVTRLLSGCAPFRGGVLVTNCHC